MNIFIICMLYFIISIITNYITKKYYHTLIFVIFICNLAILMIFNIVRLSCLIMMYLGLFIIYKVLCFIFSNKDYIIKNGKLNFNISNKFYTYDKFIKDLDRNKISSIDKISSSYIKNNKMYISNKPNIFIKDGVINYDILDLIGKDSLWLSYNILKNNLKLSEIRIAFYINGVSYFVKNV